MKKFTKADWERAHEILDKTGFFKYVIVGGETRGYTKVNGEWVEGIDENAVMNFVILDEVVPLSTFNNTDNSAYIDSPDDRT